MNFPKISIIQFFVFVILLYPFDIFSQRGTISITETSIIYKNNTSEQILMMIVNKLSENTDSQIKNFDTSKTLNLFKDVFGKNVTEEQIKRMFEISLKNFPEFRKEVFKNSIKEVFQDDKKSYIIYLYVIQKYNVPPTDLEYLFSRFPVEPGNVDDYLYDVFKRNEVDLFHSFIMRNVEEFKSKEQNSKSSHYIYDKLLIMTGVLVLLTIFFTLRFIVLKIIHKLHP